MKKRITDRDSTAVSLAAAPPGRRACRRRSRERGLTYGPAPAGLRKPRRRRARLRPAHAFSPRTRHAVQQLRLPDLVPSRNSRRFLSAWPAAARRAGMAHARVALLLRLVEPVAPAADPRQHRVQFCRRPRPAARARRARVLAFGVAANLAVLGVFKYADFFLANAARLDRRRAAPPPPRAAARHQLFHVHADRVSRRRVSPQGAGTRARQLRAFRHVLPAPARGTDPASQRDDAAVRGQVEQAAAVGQPRRRASSC